MRFWENNSTWPLKLNITLANWREIIAHLAGMNNNRGLSPKYVNSANMTTVSNYRAEWLDSINGPNRITSEHGLGGLLKSNWPSSNPRNEAFWDDAIGNIGLSQSALGEVEKR